MIVALVRELATLPDGSRVGIDGPDAAGKTTLANALSARLHLSGRRVVQRPELAALWTLAVSVECAPEETLRRARIRDAVRFGPRELVEERYRRRYLPAQARYRETVRPHERADVVLVT